jgi:hypothetical protein
MGKSFGEQPIGGVKGDRKITLKWILRKEVVKAGN